MEFLQKHIDEDWDWNELSGHPNMTIDFIKNNPTKNWNWNIISMNEFKKDKNRFMNPQNVVYNEVHPNIEPSNNEPSNNEPSNIEPTWFKMLCMYFKHLIRGK
jgi:hypothetical protein